MSGELERRDVRPIRQWKWHINIYQDIKNIKFKRTSFYKLICLIIFINIIYFLTSIMFYKKEIIKPLDFYYINIGNLSMKIPFDYLSADDITHRKNYNEVSIIANTPPGLNIDNLYMIINLDTMQGMSRSDTNKNSKPNFTELRLNTKRFAWAVKPIYGNDELIRVIKYDKNNLKAYHKITDYNRSQQEIDNNIEKFDRIYNYENESGNIFLHCEAFGFPNPVCRSALKYNELYLDYDFDYRLINNWPNYQQQLITLLKSFVAY